MAQIIVSQYNHIHTALGGEFLKVEAQADGLDPADPAAVGALAGHFGMVENILNVHSHEEEVFVWPMIEARFPDLMKPYLLDHELEHGLFDQIKADMGALQSGSATDTQATGKRVYRNIVAASSHLINHMGKEEKHPYTMFADALTDDEEAALAGEVLSRIPEELFPMSMPWLMSYLPDDQVIADLDLYQRVLSADKVGKIKSALANGMPGERWQKLVAQRPQLGS